ncbi:MAG: 4'-phosphopantetheinyl transferase [Verrucomicrobia bacterium]|nr:4'-phosphopantetheinyl transferase [Verrucomicrobiota bacterium]
MWCLDLDAVRIADLDGLSEAEIARASRFRRRLDWQRFLACRGVLREMLGKYTGQDAGDISFRYGPNGKPEMRASDAAGALPFNVSHSGQFALYAVAGEWEVGVDIEQVRPVGDMEDMARTVLSADEWERWRTLNVRVKPAVFFDCWTKKEAILKARGTGLSDNVRSITVLTEDEHNADANGMHLLTGFEPREGCRAALAARAVALENERTARLNGNRHQVMELQIS